jgi:hypothetical protein
VTVNFPPSSKFRGLAAHGTRSRYINGRCRCDACRAAESAYQRGYYEANRAKVLARSLAYYAEHRDQVVEYQRNYYAASERAEKARQRRQNGPPRNGGKCR